MEENRETTSVDNFVAAKALNESVLGSVGGCAAVLRPDAHRIGLGFLQKGREPPWENPICHKFPLGIATEGSQTLSFSSASNMRIGITAVIVSNCETFLPP